MVELNGVLKKITATYMTNLSCYRKEITFYKKKGNNNKMASLVFMVIEENIAFTLTGEI